MIVYRMKGDRLQDERYSLREKGKGVGLWEKGKGVGLWEKGKGDSYCVLGDTYRTYSAKEGV